jgi:hypothetical protein
MAARQTLGDLFNLGTSETTNKVRVNLKNTTGCYVIALTATSGAMTINECNAASAGTEQLVGGGGSGVALVYYTQNNGVWTKNTGSGSQVTCATGGLLACFVPSVLLASGFNYLDATHASAHILYMLVELQGSRDPANLVDVRA